MPYVLEKLDNIEISTDNIYDSLEGTSLQLEDIRDAMIYVRQFLEKCDKESSLANIASALQRIADLLEENKKEAEEARWWF